jgi:hypothetical protein
MALRVNPRASGTVKIPVTDLFEVTVDALRDIEHEHLAGSVGLTLEAFEGAIKDWAWGEGLPYGVLMPYVFELDSEVTTE